MKQVMWATAFVLATCAAGKSARADVKLPAVLSDNMILQRQMPIPIWGTADAAEDVTVSVGKSSAATKAAADGKWKITLDALDTAGPVEVTVKGKNTISLKNVLLGEVWICSGQSNMEMSVAGCINAPAEIASAADTQIRMFTVQKAVAGQPLADCVGTWQEAAPATAGGFSAVGYFFGRQLRADLKVPIGLIHTSWGGTPAEAWTSESALVANPQLAYLFEQLKSREAGFADAEKNYGTLLTDWQKEYDEAKAEAAKLQADAANGKLKEEKPADEFGDLEEKPKPKVNAAKKRTILELEKIKPKPPVSPGGDPWRPAGLYNAMLAPVIQYGCRGAIWYQGESNAGRAIEYRTLLQTMISDWRTQHGQDPKAADISKTLGFYIVQLANFQGETKQPVESDWAELREAQYLATTALPHVGIGTAIDIGDAVDIHPRNKQEVGRRLALAAENKTYGMADVVPGGPAYQSMKIEGDSIRLTFTNIGAGLVAKDNQPLAGFQMAGEDKQWHWATATIESDTVIVQSAEVKSPAAVRYAWANNPPSSLYNKAGLPTFPFRTDNWPAMTEGKKR